MGVYVKGLKMPDSCWNCPILDSEYGVCNILGIEATESSVHKDCPLVEVSEKHGRLVDADKIIKEMDEMRVSGEVFTTAVNYVKLTVKDASTVIEAEDRT